MTSKNDSFWARFTRVLTPPCQRADHKSEVSEPARPGPLTQPAEVLPSDVLSRNRTKGPLDRWSRREQAAAQLQDGYHRVAQAVADLQHYLAQQGDRTDRIATALEQLQRCLADLLAASGHQTETLVGIADRLGAVTNLTQRLTEAVRELPDTARKQTESLNAINLQLGKAGQECGTTTQATEKLLTAVAELAQASAAQTKSLRSLSDRAYEHNQQLHLLITQYGRRFTGLSVATALLAIAAIITVIAGIVLRG